MILADFHMHLYPEYDIPYFLHAAFSHMEQHRHRLALTEADYVFCLAQTCDFSLTQVSNESTSPGKLPNRSYRVEMSECGEFIRLIRDDGVGLFVLPGRQIATAERLEIQALGQDESVPDGLPAAETVRAVLETGSQPILLWGFGKWMLSRSRIVSSLIEQYSPDQLWIGDSAMRPVWWKKSGLLNLAARKGFTIVSGSDPLPRKGQEKNAGRYINSIQGGLHPERPLQSLYAAVRSQQGWLPTSGVRRWIP